MFVVAEIKDYIRIAPCNFHKPLKNAIAEEINKKLANKVVMNVGLSIALWDITELGDSHIIPGDGCFHTRVTFRYVVFRPFLTEILIGKVKSCSREGVIVTLGFFDEIVIPNSALQHPSRFDEAEQVWVWEYQVDDEKHDLFMDIGEPIRFRVTAESFEETSPTGPENTDGESVEPKVEENLKRSLVEIDSILKKCLRKIINKPRKAEIRNVISELVRKKNLSDMGISQEPAQVDLLDKDPCFCEPESQNIENSFKFHCNFCEEIFNSKKKFIIHKKSHKHSEKFLCDKCGKLIINFKKSQEHLMECHEPPQWSLTLKYFPNNLENKIITSDNSDLFILTEKQVESKLNSEMLLVDNVAVDEIRHSIQVNNVENQEPEEKEKKFDCSCGKTFRILKTLRKHEKLKHSLMDIKYDCSVCEKSFVEKGKLNRHMLSHKERQYRCSFCSKHFSRSDTLKRHMSLFHCNSKEFSCRYCQKIFKLKFNRDIHEENTHKNISNQIQCQHCGGKFKSKVTLKSHLKIHFGNKITCAPCCKSFTKKSYYTKHIKSKHFGVNPNHNILEGVSVDDSLNVHLAR